MELKSSLAVVVRGREWEPGRGMGGGDDYGEDGKRGERTKYLGFTLRTIATSTNHIAKFG